MESYNLINECTNTPHFTPEFIGESTVTTENSGLQFEGVSRGRRVVSLEGRKEDEDDTT
jgi:hypothetical protein